MRFLSKSYLKAKKSTDLPFKAKSNGTKAPHPNNHEEPQ